MPSVTRSASVRASADALWRKLADVESWPKWLGVPYAGESVRMLSDGVPGVGSEFVMKGRLPARLFARMTAREEPGAFAFEVYRSEYPSDRLFFGRALISVTLAPEAAGTTRITCTHRLEGKGIAGRIYAAVVMRPFIRGNARSIVESLSAAVTATG